MYRFSRKVLTVTYLGACVLLLPACHAPVPTTARHERVGAQPEEGITEPAEPVEQDDGPRKGISQRKKEPEEPAGAFNDRAGQLPLVPESARGNDTSSDKSTPERPQPESEKTVDGERKTTEPAEARNGEADGEEASATTRTKPAPGQSRGETEQSTEHPAGSESETSAPSGSRTQPAQDPRLEEPLHGGVIGESSSVGEAEREVDGEPSGTPGASGANQPPQPTDGGHVAHDLGANGATNAPTEPGGMAGSERPEAAMPVAEERANAEAPAPQPLVPVIPARVERTASQAPDEIVYPEAPPSVAVSREQIDALKLPLTDPKRPIIGVWTHVGGGNSADFAEGNYTRAVLIFRTDGVLEIVRWFGPQHEIRLDSKFNYTVTANQSIRVELPREGSTGTRQAYSIPLGDGKSVRVEPATATFPTDLTYKCEDGRLTIDTKTYRRASNK